MLKLALCITLLGSIALGQALSTKYSPRSIQGDRATCTFDVLTHAVYQNESIEHEFPAAQSKPLIIAFADMDGAAPTIRSMDVANSTSETKVVALGTAEKRVFVDVSESGNVDVWIVYREQGIAVWTRNYEGFLSGFQAGRVGIGRCQ
jgi:hypothetical protein